MFASKLFKIETTYSTDPIFTKQIVSPMHLFQNLMYSVKVGTNIFSVSTIKRPSIFLTNFKINPSKMVQVFNDLNNLFIYHLGNRFDFNYF